MNKYAWNDAMILDKIQEILKDKNIENMDITSEELERIKEQLSESISEEDLNNSSCLLAESIEELKAPKDDIKAYINKLIKYIKAHNLKCIMGEFDGIECIIYAGFLSIILIAFLEYIHTHVSLLKFTISSSEDNNIASFAFNITSSELSSIISEVLNDKLFS